MLPDAKVNMLVESARVQLTEAWQILSGLEPDGYDYLTLRLIVSDVKAFQKRRIGENERA